MSLQTIKAVLEEMDRGETARIQGLAVTRWDKHSFEVRDLIDHTVTVDTAARMIARQPLSASSSNEVGRSAL